jgi:hypothetical protein
MDAYTAPAAPADKHPVHDTFPGAIARAGGAGDSIVAGNRPRDAIVGNPGNLYIFARYRKE